jgi:tetratricopeptide (TPR) repeat protein
MNIHEQIQSAFRHLQTGNVQQAEHICRELLTIHPHDSDALYLLGIIYDRIGDYDSAIESIKKSLQFNPVNDYACFDLGNILRKKERTDEAMLFYQKAVQLNPSNAGAHYCLAVALQEKGRFEAALNSYTKVLQINPNHADTYNNMGSVLQETGQLDQAVNCYRKALSINPDLFMAYNNLGNALMERGQFDDAVAHYQKAVGLNPDFAGGYCNLGVALQNKQEINEAVAAYQKAIGLDPDYIDAHWNLSLALLLSGRFREGWKEYEWRLKKKDHIYYVRKFSHQLWDGVSDISGRTILLHAEQGLGDTIQFIRYAPLVAQRGARVVVECQKELKALLHNIGGTHDVVAYGEQLPEFDMHCPLLSLPLLFDTTLETIPTGLPYMNADTLSCESWKVKVQHDNSGQKIGLVWAGNLTNTKGRYRSCPLETFSPLARIDDITFYSLQKGEASEKAKYPPKGMKLVDYTEEIHDFSDTAALMQNLDLIISVDTAAAHLAGALGRPVWTLLPFNPDWRWMLSREDSPWYPTMRLFRQPSFGDWESVIARVAGELKNSLSK